MASILTDVQQRNCNGFEKQLFGPLMHAMITIYRQPNRVIRRNDTSVQHRERLWRIQRDQEIRRFSINKNQTLDTSSKSCLRKFVEFKVYGHNTLQKYRWSYFYRANQSVSDPEYCTFCDLYFIDSYLYIGLMLYRSLNT